MLATYPDAPWMSSDLSTHLLEFACLPSRTLHASRQQALLPAGGMALLSQLSPGTPAWRRLHRHWSVALTQAHRLPELTVQPDKSLVLAMLPTPAWDAIQWLGGAVLVAPRIRRCIAREQVSSLKEQLGEAAHSFAMGPSAILHGGWDESLALPLGQVAPTCLRWGQALQARAMQTASPAVAQRAFLRLPEAALKDADSAQFSRMASAQALQLLMSLIERTQAQWFSLFPANR
jgi:type III secretion protein K